MSLLRFGRRKTRTLYAVSVRGVADQVSTKGEVMSMCQARADRYGTIRCVACRVSWDRDDVGACPRQAPPLAPNHDPADALRRTFVSALAPDTIAAINR
jgi:hypothetical protein